jgi:hypothetical protein
MGDVAFTIMTAQGRIVEVSKYMLENKHLVRLGVAHDEVVDACCAMMLKHLSDYVAKASTKVLVLPIEISTSVEMQSRDRHRAPTNTVVCRGSRPGAWKHVASKSTTW